MRNKVIKKAIWAIPHRVGERDILYFLRRRDTFYFSMTFGLSTKPEKVLPVSFYSLHLNKHFWDSSSKSSVSFIKLILHFHVLESEFKKVLKKSI